MSGTRTALLSPRPRARSGASSRPRRGIWLLVADERVVFQPNARASTHRHTQRGKWYTHAIAPLSPRAPSGAFLRPRRGVWPLVADRDGGPTPCGDQRAIPNRKAYAMHRYHAQEPICVFNRQKEKCIDIMQTSQFKFV